MIISEGLDEEMKLYRLETESDVRGTSLLVKDVILTTLGLPPAPLLIQDTTEICEMEGAKKKTQQRIECYFHFIGEFVPHFHAQRRHTSERRSPTFIFTFARFHSAHRRGVTASVYVQHTSSVSLLQRHLENRIVYKKYSIYH